MLLSSELKRESYLAPETVVLSIDLQFSVLQTSYSNDPNSPVEGIVGGNNPDIDW